MIHWNHDIASVLDENERLKRRAERQTAIIRLLVVLLKLSRFRLEEQRLPDGTARAHNTQMPHHAFGGQTPDEVYFNQADRVRDRLTAAQHQARRAKIEANEVNPVALAIHPVNGL